MICTIFVRLTPCHAHNALCWGMPKPDLNLLVTLDVLLAEGSVARAAQRLRLSPSAMSRALSRLRETTGDPLLVRAGRGLVPTPHALELRERVSQLVQDSEAALRPAKKPNLKRLVRTFTLRTREGFIENFGAALIARVSEEAPLVTLRFAQKPDKESTALRDGTADLETGVVGTATPRELRVHALFDDRFVGVVRRGHALCRGEVTAARYAKGAHVVVSRRGLERSAIDDALEELDLRRRVVAIVEGFSAALALARGSELIATVPERHTATLREGMHTFTLPFATKEVTIALLWHPRMDADPAHRWLRGIVLDICAAPSRGKSTSRNRITE
jgi:DNA-binding transcriptional LysR family regulator